MLASAIYAVLARSGLPFFHMTLIPVLLVFLFRRFATRQHWQEIVRRAETAPARARNGSA